MSMRYTFDIDICGCNTRCAHCYIDGGAASAMAADAFILAVNKLKVLLDRLTTPGNPDGSSIYLDREIFNHPCAPEFLRHLHATAPDYFPFAKYGIPTAGIALAARRDRCEVLSALRDVGCNTFTLTLHGSRESHNEIAQNAASFDSVLRVADFLTANGLSFEFNLMFSKRLISGFDTVTGIVQRYPAAFVNPTIPNYIPTQRLRAYQTLRAGLSDIMSLRGRLADAGIIEEEFFSRAKAGCEQIVLKEIDTAIRSGGFSYEAEDKKQPTWAFFNISPSSDLYYGNSGARTRYLCNLSNVSDDELYQKVMNLPPNYDWSAYYDIATLPDIVGVIQKANRQTTDLVYNSAAECVYSWLDLCGAQSIILPAPMNKRKVDQ